MIPSSDTTSPIKRNTGTIPRLTIGLPVHNAMPYLPQTVDSLLAQTDTDFELLIVDDGSSDDSPAYLRSLNDTRVRILTQENQGLTATLNRMLREAQTPWLLRQDADDIALPDRVAIVRHAITCHPDAGMFYSRASYIQEGRSFGSFRTTIGSPAELREFTRKGKLLAICHPTAVLNVQKAISVGGYRFNLHVEDIDLWWRMALEADVVFVPEYTIGYRITSTGVSTRSLAQQSLNTLYVQYLLLSHLWELNPLDYDQVVPTLRTMLDISNLRFRERIRKANMLLGAGKRFSAAAAALGALLASPADFARRTLYEIGQQGPALVGEKPSRFASLADQLWTPAA